MQKDKKRKTDHINNNIKVIGVTLLISDKIDFHIQLIYQFGKFHIGDSNVRGFRPKDRRLKPSDRENKANKKKRDLPKEREGLGTFRILVPYLGV